MEQEQPRTSGGTSSQDFVILKPVPERAKSDRPDLGGRQPLLSAFRHAVAVAQILLRWSERVRDELLEGGGARLSLWACAACRMRV